MRNDKSTAVSKEAIFVEPVANLGIVAADETPTVVAGKIQKFGFRSMLDKGYLQVTAHPSVGAVVSEPNATLSSQAFEPNVTVASKIKKYGRESMLKKGYIIQIP